MAQHPGDGGVRIFREFRYGTALLTLARKQQKTIAKLMAQNMELRRQALDLACAWRLSLERPEVDVRDNLSAMISDLQDELAVLEEHRV